MWLFNLSLALNFALAFFYPQFLKLVTIQFLIKFTAELFFLESLTTFAKRKGLLINLTFLTFLHVVYFIYIGVMGNAGKYQWKDRMVK